MSEVKSEILRLFEELDYDIDAIIAKVNFYASIGGLTQLEQLHLKAFTLTLHQLKIIGKYCITDE